MNNSVIIKTTGLSYHYSKEEQTLFDIDLRVERGSIYGFLGPNGSGKTTTLSLLLGLLKNQQGDIEIFGEHLHSNRSNILKRVGSLIETPSLYGHLTARENLEVYREVYGARKDRITEVLRIVGLQDTGTKTTKKFSLGMKQRLAIALALLPSPDLLILDEPANGLDPAGIIELRELLKMLNQTYGMTILISSHLLAEIEKLVSDIGIIVNGKLVFQGALSELESFQQKDSKLLIDSSDNEKAITLLQEYDPERRVDGFAVSFKGKEQIAVIQRALTQQNIDVYLIRPQENDLEQLFIELTTTQK